MLETRITWHSSDGTARRDTCIGGSDAQAVQLSFVDYGLSPSTRVLVERFSEGSVLATCITLAYEVVRWNPDKQVIPRPTAGLGI